MAAPTKKPTRAAPAGVDPLEPTAPATPDLSTMQAELAALKAQLAAAQAEAAVAKLTPSRELSGQYVGIRNASNYAIDLPPSPQASEPGVQLVPDTVLPDPRQVAIISYAWWLQLRNHSLVANGMITRDDSVLGPSHTPAPPDEAKDMPREASVNLVQDVGAFFHQQSEQQIVDRINAMTSEQTIKRLMFAIDQEVKRIQDALPYDQNNPAKRAQDAVKALPGKLVKAEQALNDRYLQLTAKYREA